MYAIEMGSGAIIYIPTFSQILVQTLKGFRKEIHTDSQTHTHTHVKRQQGAIRSLLLFFPNTGSRLKNTHNFPERQRSDNTIQ
jgi:hypothetical protein